MMSSVIGKLFNKIPLTGKDDVERKIETGEVRPVDHSFTLLLRLRTNHVDALAIEEHGQPLHA